MQRLGRIWVGLAAACATFVFAQADTCSCTRMLQATIDLADDCDASCVIENAQATFANALLAAETSVSLQSIGPLITFGPNKQYHGRHRRHHNQYNQNQNQNGNENENDSSEDDDNDNDNDSNITLLTNIVATLSIAGESGCDTVNLVESISAVVFPTATQVTELTEVAICEATTTTPTQAPATATPAPATATPAPETATPAPATATPAPETATPAPATATPAPATATPAPATATPAPATATPAPETATPAPATATPAPATATPAPETATPMPTADGTCGNGFCFNDGFCLNDICVCTEPFAGVFCEKVIRQRVFVSVALLSCDQADQAVSLILDAASSVTDVTVVTQVCSMAKEDHGEDSEDSEDDEDYNNNHNDADNANNQAIELTAAVTVELETVGFTGDAIVDQIKSQVFPGSMSLLVDQFQVITLEDGTPTQATITPEPTPDCLLPEKHDDGDKKGRVGGAVVCLAGAGLLGVGFVLLGIRCISRRKNRSRNTNAVVSSAEPVKAEALAPTKAIPMHSTQAETIVVISTISKQ